MRVIDTLITDRKAGAKYNATDLNRMGAALNYIKDLLVGKCGFVVPWTAKTDWAVDDEPAASQMAAYLDCVKDCRAKLAVAIQAPETMARLTVDGANDIERILKEADQLIANIQAAWFYAGEVNAGEV